MRSIRFHYAIMLISLSACSPTQISEDGVKEVPIEVFINLSDVKNDKVHVVFDPGRIAADTISFFIPKTVPGTYSNDNYGVYIDSLTAIDYKGQRLPVSQRDSNSWLISNATQLDKISYWVQDSFDTESEKDEPVFSPAGSNIKAKENFFINWHMFTGYLFNLSERPYLVNIQKPEGFEVRGGLTPVTSKNVDPMVSSFYASRYFELTDNPVMVTPPATETFQLGNMKVELTVYSPNGVYTASDLLPSVQKMMEAQSRFLGDLASADRYNILLYLSPMNEESPQGLGALEHHRSTTVVLPEDYPLEAMTETMTDVISHEFFHIVTPLNLHSEEVHFFNYNYPKMSQHLWLYEGVTEYFSHLFQVQQGLIQEEEFYNRITQKIQGSYRFNDSIPFTELSEKILLAPYKDDYYNVYEKGALIAMCLDILLLEESDGKEGIKSLMKKLSDRYGIEKPFNDKSLFSEIASLTSPSIKEFMQTFVGGGTPIPYDDFFNKIGLDLTLSEESTTLFFKDEDPFIDAYPATGEIFVREIPLHSYFQELGLKGGDIITHINGTAYSLENAQDLIFKSMIWQEGEVLTFTIKRDEKVQTLSAPLFQPKIEVMRLRENPEATEHALMLRDAWLKG